MSRKYIPGQSHVQIIGDVHEINEYGSRNGNVIPAASHAKCEVDAYNERGTSAQTDDMVKLEIVSIDPGYEEHKGHTFWVASAEFNKLRNI